MSIVIQQAVQERGGKIVIVGATSAVRDVLDMLGLALIFEFADTTEEALKLFND